MLIRWTEDNFVFRTRPESRRPSGAPISSASRIDFNHKMDYQTARYAAACARWYAASGDEAYKEKAYRSLNWVTYCNDDQGQANESPVSTGISNWWSDSYGEGPRMFYPAFAGVPEWAPPREDHLLYSQGVIKAVAYSAGRLEYEPADAIGVEYLRVSFQPKTISAAGTALSKRAPLDAEGYTLRDLGEGDYALTIRRAHAGKVVVQ